MVRPLLVTVLVLGAACAGCAPWTPKVADGTRAPAGPAGGEVRRAALGAGDESLAGFLALATPGEARAVAGAGGELLVTVVRDYHAASGRTCRRLLVSEDGEAPQERAACRDELSVWRLLPLLHNRELPRLTAGAAAPGGSS